MALAPGNNSIPDYVRCGSALYYITWPRLIFFVAAILIGTFIVVETSEHLPTESDTITLGGEQAAAADARPPIWRAHPAPRKVTKVRSTKPGVMAPFCKAAGSLVYLGSWHMAHLGGPDYPAAEDDAKYCDWLEHAAAEFPFRCGGQVNAAAGVTRGLLPSPPCAAVVWLAYLYLCS